MTLLARCDPVLSQVARIEPLMQSPVAVSKKLSGQDGDEEREEEEEDGLE